jgi:phosphoglycerate dehydrogenase-like enzyme
MSSSNPPADKAVVIVEPHPYRYHQIFTNDRRSWLEKTFNVVVAPDGEQLPEEEFEKYLGEAVAIVGLMELERDRLERASKLKVIFNSGGNFKQNIDYEYCFDHKIHVLNCGPAYAEAVAEMALALALDLGRGISAEDRRFRAGAERYLFAGNLESVSLFRARVGLIGFGSIGRELLPLLVPFRAKVSIYDPWLPDGAIVKAGAVPAELDAVLSGSDFVFVLAGATAENEGFLDAARLDRIAEGTRFVLVSRAAVVEFDALLDRVAAGRFAAALDVWPVEPVPADSRARSMDGLVLSPHRAGGLAPAFYEIGEMIGDDLGLIMRGLAPVRMQQAAWELVRRYRSR